MTCIVGIASHGIVYMGADSAGSDGWAEQVVATPKLFKRGPFLIGYTTSFRMGQLLQHWLDVPERTPGQAPVDYMVRIFVEEARRVFRERGFAKIEHNQEEGGEFLVGYGGRLFHIGTDFHVLEFGQGFMACGKGYLVALGALHALQRQQVGPRPAILAALHAASEISEAVRPPFHLQQLANAGA